MPLAYFFWSSDSYSVFSIKDGFQTRSVMSITRLFLQNSLNRKTLMGRWLKDRITRSYNELGEVPSVRIGVNGTTLGGSEECETKKRDIYHFRFILCFLQQHFG